MVGLIPLLPNTPVPASIVERGRELGKHFARFVANLQVSPDRVREGGYVSGLPGHESLLLSVVPPARLELTLREMLAEDGFLSPYGLRALSRRHLAEPFRMDLGGFIASVDYEPGESTSGLFGGNSNWRGPIWFPLNYLAIESLRRWDTRFGSSFTIEYPTGSGRRVRLRDVSADLIRRLVSIWLPDADGRRPVYGPYRKFDDPEWRDLLLFHEYFHGDTGVGLGASHQTGWTGLVAHLLCRGGTLDLLEHPPGEPTAR